MQVAVARVAEREADQVVAAADLERLLDRLLDAVDRDDDVLADHAAAAGDHREGEPGAPLPQRRDVCALARRVDADRARAGGVDDLRADALRLGQRAVGLGHQQEPGALGHPAGEGRATAGERLAVEQLERRRDDPAADEREHRRAPLGRPG